MSRYYQGRYTAKHPEKYEGDPTQIIYRSSWELKFLVWCDLNPNVLKFSSEEVVIPYICGTDNKVHRYFPDAKVTVKTKSGEVKTYLVEIKPKKQTVPPAPPKRKTKSYLEEATTWIKNASKWKYAREYCKDRGYEFLILTEDHLNV